MGIFSFIPHKKSTCKTSEVLMLLIIYICICEEIGPPGQKEVYSAGSNFSISQVLIVTRCPPDGLLVG
jgi:hypothetical protein